jgi:RNA polymerase sigma-70 factor (ECF subfamily)
VPAASDLPAVAEIYAEFGTFVWRNLRRLGIPETHIEDAVQDVFLVIHRRLPEFEGRSSLRTWIFGIVMRVAAREREHLRSHAQRFAPVPGDALETLAPATGKDPFDRLVQQRAADLIELVLGELEEDKRNMLVMVELEEIPVVEVAEVLEINVNSAYTRLRLARRELEARLKRVLGKSGGAV